MEDNETSVAPESGTEVNVGTSQEGTATAAPADSGGDPSTSPESVSAESKTPEFDWDTWDGKVEALPEEARFWATGVQGYVSKSYEKQLAEANRAAEAYNAILEGMEDPRLKELEEKIATGEATRAEVEEKLQRETAARNELQAAYDNLVETQAREEYAAFQAEFADLLKDKKKEEQLRELLEDDLFSRTTLKELGLLVTLSEEARKDVREIMSKENVSAEFAIKFVQATRNEVPAKPKEAPKPSESRKLVAGATRNGKPPKAVKGEENVLRPKSLSEAKARVTAKYEKLLN